MTLNVGMGEGRAGVRGAGGRRPPAPAGPSPGYLEGAQFELNVQFSKLAVVSLGAQRAESFGSVFDSAGFVT